MFDNLTYPQIGVYLSVLITFIIINLFTPKSYGNNKQYIDTTIFVVLQALYEETIFKLLLPHIGWSDNLQLSIFFGILHINYVLIIKSNLLVTIQCISLGILRYYVLYYVSVSNAIFLHALINLMVVITTYLRNGTKHQRDTFRIPTAREYLTNPQYFTKPTRRRSCSDITNSTRLLKAF